MLLMLLTMDSTFAAAMLWQSTPPPPSAGAQGAPAGVAASDGAADDAARTLGAHDIRVEAADATIRWFRIYTEDGSPALRGRPDIDGALEAGTYRLEAKVAGRETAMGTLDVRGPVMLECRPRKKGIVHCEGSDDSIVELQP